MADVICNDIYPCVKDVGCRQTRVTLQALEPGSQIWLRIDDDLILFERMQDGVDGQRMLGFSPVGDTAQLCLQNYKKSNASLLDLEFIERPEDKACGDYYQKMKANHDQ